MRKFILLFFMCISMVLSHARSEVINIPTNISLCANLVGFSYNGALYNEESRTWSISAQPIIELGFRSEYMNVEMGVSYRAFISVDIDVRVTMTEVESYAGKTTTYLTVDELRSAIEQIALEKALLALTGGE